MENLINPEAQEAGFHEFPEAQTGRRFRLPGRAGTVLGVIALLLVIFGAIPAFAAYNNAKKLVSSGQEFQAALQAQNLEAMKTSLKKVKQDLVSFDGSLRLLSWTQFIPFVGGYWQDAKHASSGGLAGIEAGEIIIATIGPYADILGFDGGQQAEDGAKTAEDRINFVVETIDDIVPKLGEISQKTQKMSQEINQIDPARYPASFRGKKVREKLAKGIDFVNEVNNVVTNGKPVLEQAPYLLGIQDQRSYLVLWQNDKEIRPTGGFITAYSIITVKDGKLKPVSSNDIYNLDRQFNSRIPAPEPIKKYLPLVPYWYLRDMNLSPDFKVSMDTFSENYAKIRNINQIDGIIAVDTQVVVDVLKVIGQIGVPGFGNYSANEDPRCNCPQVIYELESFADVAGPIVWADDLGGKIVYKPPHADNRKVILGPLVNSLVANAMGQPKDKLPGLFQAAWKGLTEKHVLFYFRDEEVQNAVEAFNLAGRIGEHEGDYLHINDTNFAGAKSNLYVEQEVSLSVEPGKNGSVNALKIKYKNPQKHDGWLNGPFRDWVRVYVPEGSELVDSTGSEVPVTTGEELGKTFFEGFFTLRPLGVTELTFKYKTPVKNQDYSLLVQKQPGTAGHLYQVSVGGRQEEFSLTQDKELRF